MIRLGNPWTVQFHGPFRWRIVPSKKIMDLSRPRSDRPVLWTVTGSNCCLVSALKRHRSTSFSPPIRRRLEHTFSPLSKITLGLFLTLSITLSSPPFSFVAVAAQPRSQLSPNHSSLSQSLSASLSRSSLSLSLVAVATHSLPRCRHRHLVLYFL